MNKRFKSIVMILLITILNLYVTYQFDPGTAEEFRNDFQTPDKNIRWTMSELAFNASPVVVESGNQYEFFGNVTISPKATLLIQPGEKLVFNKNTTLEIFGNVEARGTASSKIRFTKNASVADDYYWAGLYFDGSRTLGAQKNSILDFCIIEYASVGVFCNSSSVKISNNIIHFNSEEGIRLESSNSLLNNNTIYNVTYGVSINNSKDIELKENHFTKVQTAVIVTNESKVKIDSNKFENYNGSGIVVASNDTTLINNNFKFINTAITIDSQDNLTISDNFFDNVTNAITAKKISNSEISYNMLNFTSNSCIEISNSNNINISFNEIENHFDNGIELTDCSGISIYGNLILFGHGISIKVKESDNTKLIGNRIYYSFHRGMRLDDSLPKSFHSNLINDSFVYDLEILGDMTLESLNNSFDYNKLYLDSKIELTVNNYFDILAIDRDNYPIENVLIEIYTNDVKTHTYYTDSNGEVNNIILTYREYNGNNNYNQDQVIMTAAYGNLEFDFSPLEVDVAHSLSVILKSNFVPELKILSPKENTTLSGVVRINGSAFDPDTDIQNIQIQLGNSQWTSVIPDNEKWTIWHYILDTTMYSDGFYQLNFSISDGYSTGTKSVPVIILNGDTIEKKLSIKISYPEESEAVWDTIIVSGLTTAGDFKIKNVLVQIDNDQWKNATPKRTHEVTGRDNMIHSREIVVDWSNWTYEIDTRTLTNGEHIIRAIVTDGYDVAVDSKNVFISNLAENQTVELHADFDSPENGANVSGLVNISGIVWGSKDKIIDFKLNIDGRGITNTDNAQGPNWWVWFYRWDTTFEENGLHQLQVWARNKTLTMVNEIYVKVENDIENESNIIDLSILIIKPGEGTKLNGTVTISGITWSEGKRINYVQIRIDEGQWFTATEDDDNWARWSYEWDTGPYQDGIHTLTAEMNTTAGTLSTSMVVIVNNECCDSPLSVVITAPKDDSVVSGTVIVRGVAWYGGHPIISVEVQFGPYLWASATPLRDDWSIWFYEWNSTKLKNGNYTLQCRVWDGYSEAKDSIEIQIKNEDQDDENGDTDNGDTDNGDKENGEEPDSKSSDDKNVISQELLISLIIMINVIIILILLLVLIRLKSPESEEEEFGDELEEEEE